MASELLQEMVEAVAAYDLPAAWTTFDLESFSREKRLWPQQQQALENALKALQRYYDAWHDYRPNEGLTQTTARKVELFNWYVRNGLEPESLDLELTNNTIKNRRLIRMLEAYYPSQEEELQVYTRTTFAYRNFINRMCFWMATGSGKTLVLIKLVEMLHALIGRGEIAENDILILTYRDDLVRQIKEHVREFNAAHSGISIRLYGLKEYDSVKYGSRPLPGEVPVFIYRSDNLSDSAGQKILDFRSYENDGRWYVLLDEAHKGDPQESKRQQIYSILSRNGFLFNFSATFTDERDVVTTVFNFNLAEFIRAGYGKHIAVLEQEIRAFRDEEDYSDEEKQKIVLKSFLVLAYIQQMYQELQSETPLYHKPLLVMIGHTVNTGEADVKLFFREIARIGRDDVVGHVWQAAKDELWGELRQRPPLMFEEDRVHLRADRYDALSLDDVRELVFNERSAGEIEVLRRPSDRQEVAFKLKTSDRPFALIKIGDISDWLKGELIGYEINETFDNEGYFESLNDADSDIKILMGSRAFYEGWDSNRPNVMTFVNIGMGTEARKFILQSVGRGVRIEPVANERRRMLPLSNAGKLPQASVELAASLGDVRALPIETLFIFGTNRSALHYVIEHLDRVQRKEESYNLELRRNEKADEHRLLIPVFKEAEHLLAEDREPRRFETTGAELDLLAAYAGAMDDRVLLARYGVPVDRVSWLRRSLGDRNTYYRAGGRSVGHLDILARRAFDYFGVVGRELDRIKDLEDEIRHYRHIKVTFRDFYTLQQKVEQVSEYPVVRERLELRYVQGQLSFDEVEDEIRGLRRDVEFEHDGQTVAIRYIAEHYYVPVLVAESARVDYIKHIIKVPSEVAFVNGLQRYLRQRDHLFHEFDWWLFSKLDESLDEIALPYYDAQANRMRSFKPDFIFWLQRGSDYSIVFIDPKGTRHTDYEYKIDGYRYLFENGNGVRTVEHDGLNVKVYVFLHCDDVNALSEGYRPYWFDSMGIVLQRVLA